MRVCRRRTIARYVTDSGLTSLEGCHVRKTVRTESQSVWHWSQHTRCTDSYTEGDRGVVGFHERKRGRWMFDKVAGARKKKRYDQRDAPLRVVRVCSSLLLLS